MKFEPLETLCFLPPRSEIAQLVCGHLHKYEKLLLIGKGFSHHPCGHISAQCRIQCRNVLSSIVLSGQYLPPYTSSLSDIRIGRQRNDTVGSRDDVASLFFRCLVGVYAGCLVHRFLAEQNEGHEWTTVGDMRWIGDCGCRFRCVNGVCAAVGN
jgi:hypothetical protein